LSKHHSREAVMEMWDEFIDTYDSEEGIVAFVRDVLGDDPDENQEQLLRAIARGERRVAVRSGHGVGKTTVLAWAIVWHLTVKFPQKTVCTAPTKNQLYDALAAETSAKINKLPDWLRDLFDVKVEEITLIHAPKESFVAFNTSRADTPEAMAGIHSDWVLLIGDEASGIPEPVYEAAIGSMSGHNAVTVLAGNPVRTTGLFYEVFNKPAVSKFWFKLHISCIGHKRVAQDFIDDVIRRYGKDSNAYRVRVLGEFPKSDLNTVISRELAVSAMNRDVRYVMVRPVWGVDVARFGDDSSALAKRRGNVMDGKVAIKQGWDMMQVAGWVKSEWDNTLPDDRPTSINIDVIGLGAGVVDRLNELGLPAYGVNVSERSAIFSDKYANLRAELWWKGREWLERLDCSISGDEELMDELCGPTYSFASSGKIKIESKDEMKKRGIPSPNRADAFLLTLATEAISVQHGSSSPTGRSNDAPLERDIAVV
jgi:phage terminase large subunit